MPDDVHSPDDQYPLDDGFGMPGSTVSWSTSTRRPVGTSIPAYWLGRDVPVTPILHIHGVLWEYPYGLRGFGEWSLPLELLIQGVREIHINHYRSAKGLRAIRLKKAVDRRDQIFAFRLTFNSTKVWQDNDKKDHPFFASYDCRQPHVKYDVENGLIIYTDRGEDYVFRAEDCAFTGKITRSASHGS